MKEKDPLKELHKIRERNYKKTKNMSASEYIRYIQKRALRFRKTSKQYKELDRFFTELNKNKKAG